MNPVEAALRRVQTRIGVQLQESELPDRLTVQLSEDAAKAREELFRDKKTKKKAGDA